MKELRSHLIGVDQGDVALFSDFEDGGEMWIGEGPRERRRLIRFSRPFLRPPAVHLGVSLWDVDTASAMRAEIVSENITEQAFEIVFRTWLDTHVARVRVAWMAIGELASDDDWDVR